MQNDTVMTILTNQFNYKPNPGTLLSNGPYLLFPDGLRTTFDDKGKKIYIGRLSPNLIPKNLPAHIKSRL